MISVTPLWNSNRSSKPAARALRNTNLKEICNISSALTAKSESLSHTSQSVTATHCRARITFSTTEHSQKKNAVQMSSAFWCSPAFMLTKPKIYRWRHHHADRTRSRSFSVIVVEILYLTTVNKCGLMSSEHELMKYVAHAPETIRLPLFLWKTD